VFGVVNDEIRATMVWRDIGKVRETPGEYRRILANCSDYASCVFSADIDDLDVSKICPGFDARENIDDLHDIVRNFVCEIGADYLAADKVIQISSSYGYVGRDKLSVHVDWQLALPLSSEEASCGIAQ
jgi:hypothetical protein